MARVVSCCRLRVLPSPTLLKCERQVLTDIDRYLVNHNFAFILCYFHIKKNTPQ